MIKVYDDLTLTEKSTRSCKYSTRNRKIGSRSGITGTDGWIAPESLEDKKRQSVKRIISSVNNFNGDW